MGRKKRCPEDADLEGFQGDFQKGGISGSRECPEGALAHFVHLMGCRYFLLIKSLNSNYKWNHLNTLEYP